MKTENEAVAAQATVVHDVWDESFEALMGRVASCFPRREPRLTCRNMVQGLLMVKDSANCWSPAEAIGHAGPHVLQHFLSRARFDTEAIRRSAAAWTVEQLGGREVMLVVDETGDEKSSLDAVGAARQYSGALGACISISACSGGVGGRVDHACVSARCRVTGKVRSDPAASRRAPPSALPGQR